MRCLNRCCSIRQYQQQQLQQQQRCSPILYQTGS
nr:MAG TPA: hypothetical protein [Bacteriophage sp.]DAW00792.1 MAG TPA: hypothetical protein [Bacteriophage sp.]